MKVGKAPISRTTRSSVCGGIAVSDASYPMLSSGAALHCPRCGGDHVDIDLVGDRRIGEPAGYAVDLRVLCSDCYTWSNLSFVRYADARKTWVMTDPRRWHRYGDSE